MPCRVVSSLLLVFCTAATWAATLGVEETTQSAGSGDIPIALYFDPVGAAVSGLQCDLVFDTSTMAFQTIPAPTRGDAAIAAGKSFAVQLVEPGRLRIVVAGGQSALPAGILGTVFIDVALDVTGLLPITLDNALATDPWGLSVGLVLVDGGIVVPPPPRPPVAAFSGSPRSGIAPLRVSYTDESDPTDGEIVSWFWEFGDGATSDVKDAFHVYETAGAFDVRLTITATQGQGVLTRQGYVTVYSPDDIPKADFTATPVSGRAPLTVAFADYSLDGAVAITEWQWDFGDGGRSSDQHPNHVYTVPGTYTVSLRVTSDIGADTLTMQDLVRVTDMAGGPLALFSASPTEGAAPLSVAFVDESMSASPILRWEWDFGDGSTSLLQHPVHVFSEAGSYDVRLTVLTDDGQDTLTRADCVVILPAVPPTADFSAAPQRGAAPLAVVFTDGSETGSAAVEGWFWEFGDGETSVERNPVHTYTLPGSYDVALTVTTAVGSDRLVREDMVTVEDDGDGKSPFGCGGASDAGGADGFVLALCVAVLARWRNHGKCGAHPPV